MRKSSAVTLALLLTIVLVAVGVSVGITTKKRKQRRSAVDPYWADFDPTAERGSDTDHHGWS